MELSWLIGFHK